MVLHALLIDVPSTAHIDCISSNIAFLNNTAFSFLSEGHCDRVL